MLWVFACVAAAAALLPPRAGGDAPPPDAYSTWLQQHFPAAYGNPALEASVWGDHADPDGDGCGNLLEFMMQRDPNVADAQLGLRCRLEGGDLVATYRETTATGHSVTWLGEWSGDWSLWLAFGVRYQTLETHSGYRLVEARVTRNRESQMFFRLAAHR
ncbi:MAG: hypothetical protein NTW21_15870 [Verrucomicrobia bacterium]|nr:hypothetical protein [Verrucomicrobiota bacterium]